MKVKLSFWVCCITLWNFTATAALTIPTQVSPTDQATNQPTGVQLNLKNSNGTTYAFEYSTTLSMSNPVRIEVKKGSFNTRQWIYKLQQNTTYYWRAKAISNSDSSNWTSIWSFTTSNTIQRYHPSSTGATLNYSKIYLSCFRTAPYDTFELQLDTTPLFNSTINRHISIPDTFKSFYIESFQENLRYGSHYYWRFRGIHNKDSSSWSDSGDFMIYDSIVPKYPTASVKEDVEVQFDWQSGSIYEAFQVQLDTSPFFNSIALIDTLSIDGTRKFDSNPFKVGQLMYETHYYYRVRAFNAADTTYWSQSEFTTNGFAPNFTFSDQYVDPIADLRVYRTIEGSEGYEFQIDLNNTFDSEDFRSLYSSDGNITLDTLNFGGIYHVRSRPYHTKDTGDWSKTRTISVLQFPTTYYPYNNWMDINITDSLIFSTRRGIDGFQIQISESIDFNSELFLDSTLYGLPIFDDPAVKTRLFKFNQDYYWRMRCWHKADTSIWSTSKKFTTQVSPKLIKPYNSDFLGTNTTTLLEWERVKGAVTYHLMVDTSIDFSSKNKIDTLISLTNTFALTELYFGKLYYWKLKAIGIQDTSDWSETWQFKIFTPRLTYPSNNIKNLTLTSLDWASIQGTSGYILEIDSTLNFSNPWQIQQQDSNSFFHYFLETPSIITFNTQYFWRVKLFHNKDTSSWSHVWNFTTKPRRSPTLIAPKNLSEDVPVIASLSWNKYSGAASYTLAYSTKQDFTNAIKVSVSGNAKTLALKEKTTYYWRVIGKNSSNQEFYDWSETWQFTTDEGLPAPQLVSPQNMINNLNTDVTLNWEKTSGATSYTIELSNSPDFIGVFKRTSNTNSYTYSDLNHNTLYYWRVKTTAGSISSPWSEEWQFTTEKDRSKIVQATYNPPLINPIPANSSITIDCKNSNYKPFHICNNWGAVVFEFSSADTKTIHNLDITEWPAGIYYLRLSNGSKNTYKKILIH